MQHDMPAETGAVFIKYFLRNFSVQKVRNASLKGPNALQKPPLIE